jgi:riboflavin synthase
MFTGLITERGRITSLQTAQAVVRLTLEAPKTVASGLQVGDSVACQGICLTAVAIIGFAFTVEAVPETAARTTLGHWRVHDRINLERPLALGGRLDGHLVAGHVDGVARVDSIRQEGDSRRIWLRAPKEFMGYLAPKGSVALDGVSLTVAEVKPPDGFAVALIPHTLAQTGLEEWAAGRAVNLEVDLIARYVESLRVAAAAPADMTWERLHGAGF